MPRCFSPRTGDPPHLHPLFQSQAVAFRPSPMKLNQYFCASTKDLPSAESGTERDSGIRQCGSQLLLTYEFAAVSDLGRTSAVSLS